MHGQTGAKVISSYQIPIQFQFMFQWFSRQSCSRDCLIWVQVKVETRVAFKSRQRPYDGLNGPHATIKNVLELKTGFGPIESLTRPLMYGFRNRLETELSFEHYNTVSKLKAHETPLTLQQRYSTLPMEIQLSSSLPPILIKHTWISLSRYLRSLEKSQVGVLKKQTLQDSGKFIKHSVTYRYWNIFNISHQYITIIYSSCIYCPTLHMDIRIIWVNYSNLIKFMSWGEVLLWTKNKVHCPMSVE